MKYLPALLFFIACNPAQQQPGNNGTSPGPEKTVVRTDTVYVTRNVMINPANSYSDLFLDSNVVEEFINTEKLNKEEAAAFRSFYNYRNMQFAWFSSLGFTEQARGFWNLQDELHAGNDKALRKRIDSLLDGDTILISRFDTAMVHTELAMSKAFLSFYRGHRDSTLLSWISPEKLLPVKKENAMVLADSMLAHTGSSGITGTPYFLLLQKLRLYRDIAQKGGWRTVIFPGKQLKKGTPSPVIALVKKRLALTGEISARDTSAVFDDSLSLALRNYQQRNGMKAAGIITDTLVRSLNVPVDKRIQQIIINLYRMQWMTAAPGKDRVTVNIPDFRLAAFENNAKVFDMAVVVGKEGTNTTLFSGKLNQVVFSPYWNIPASIVKKEIVPAMEADKNYLQSKNMEIVGKRDGLPVIRQRPGTGNALGRIKFLFPNRYDIYFHDTYAKDLFNREVRALSHGCIRLADAAKMANWLLRNKKEWTEEKVAAAMNSGKEQSVKVDPAMPVTITYFTTWVDEDGQLNFRNDVYGNDKKVSQMLFSNYVMPGSLPIDSLRK